MENKLRKLLDRIRNLPVPGKVQAAVKIVLFVDVAVLIGLWLGIEIFFPDDFIISKINEQLFIKDLALLSEDVDVSLLGNVSFEEGTLLQKGSKVLTFSELSFSPSIFATLGGHPAGKLHIEDINSQGGGLDASFDTSENPCYSLDASEVPLSLFKPLLGEVLLTGTLSGAGDLCSKEGKYNGKAELSGTDVVLRGKVPTPMGDFDVGKIILGDVGLETEIVDSKAEIKRLSIKGIVELEAVGKITLNTRNFSSSRLDLEVTAKVPDMAKISENVALNLLVSQLSQYKGEAENTFEFSLKGFLNKPQMSRTQKKEHEQRSEQRQQKKPSARPQRQQRGDRLPQREAVPKPMPPAPAAGNASQNDDLKKKEDELKRKEEELKQKEEAAKEREEKMREEREQREKEERERREQEERSRREEEARIKEAQEAAMNEIRKVREEMEAAKKARESQEEGESEQPKPAAEERESEEE